MALGMEGEQFEGRVDPSSRELAEVRVTIERAKVINYTKYNITVLYYIKIIHSKLKVGGFQNNKTCIPCMLVDSMRDTV